MKIFIGSDHRGFELKTKLFAYLSKHDYNVEDVGDKQLNPQDDYPQFAQEAAIKLVGSEDEDPRSILICGGGQGMAIAANRFKGIRAVVITDAHDAKMSRIDNDSNILSLSADRFEDEEEVMYGIIETWLTTEFAGQQRHVRRLKEIDEFYPNM